MKRPLLRCLDDAICAFVTGHSRRDLDRVRMRRFQLLAGRIVLRHYAAAEATDWGFLATRLRASAQTVAELMDRVVVRRERIAEAALLQEFQIDRSSLYSRRRHDAFDRQILELSPDAQCRALETLPVASPKLYGKLYEGLLEQVGPDLFLECSRFCARNGHRVLRCLMMFAEAATRRLDRAR